MGVAPSSPADLSPGLRLVSASSADAEALLGQMFLSRSVRDRVELFSREEGPVLLTGESGTGKTSVARVMHGLSPRQQSPFVQVDSATLSGDTLMSILFGHEKGSFTGAVSGRKGLLFTANGGTVFLDDAQTLTLEAQHKLLGVMETGEYRPLGSDKTYRTDVRFMVAFSEQISRLYREGKLSPDFIARLAGFHIDLLPIRSSVLYMRRAIDATLKELDIPRDHLSDGAEEALSLHPFCGNFRELQSVLKTAYVLSNRQWIESTHIVEALRSSVTILLNLTPSSSSLPPPLSLEEGLSQAKKDLIIRALRWTRGHKTQAAKILGVNPRTLFRFLQDDPIDLAALMEGDTDSEVNPSLESPETPPAEG